MAMGDFDPLTHYGRGYCDDPSPRWRTVGHNGTALVHGTQDKRGRAVVRVKAWRTPNEDGADREPGAFFRSDGRLFKRAPRAAGYDRDEPLPIPPVFR